ncbi:hypothetical protein [uncultured Arthrobacter sp.]|uniref:hypothetical protein n=1 Tax=uncultured Arthrobacter sp. TaxID=114050 RepID=UPI0032168BAC
MTNPSKRDADTSGGPSRELPLLADHKELLKLRIRPSEFARLLGVSKQAVSQWISQGKIGQPNHLDGRIDVQRGRDAALQAA